MTAARGQGSRPSPPHEEVVAISHPSGSSVVWIVNQYAGSPRHGMEYRHYYLARALAGRGHRVVVITGTRSHLFTRPPEVSRPFTLETIDGVTYCWVAGPRYERAISLGRIINMAAFALRLERLPVAKLPRPDAILVSSPSLFPLPVAARWARRFGARLAFEVRDIWPLTIRELGGLSTRHPLVVLMQWLEDFGYRSADVVVSVLPAAADHMVSRGMDPAKFHYLPNGIDLDGARGDGAAPSVVREAIKPGAFTVGFVGTLGRANVLETLIDAARLVEPDVVVRRAQRSGQAEQQRFVPGARDLEERLALLAQRDLAVVEIPRHEREAVIVQRFLDRNVERQGRLLQHLHAGLLRARLRIRRPTLGA